MSLKASTAILKHCVGWDILTVPVAGLPVKHVISPKGSFIAFGDVDTVANDLSAASSDEVKMRDRFILGDHLCAFRNIDPFTGFKAFLF